MQGLGSISAHLRAPKKVANFDFEVATFDQLLGGRYRKTRRYTNVVCCEVLSSGD